MQSTYDSVAREVDSITDGLGLPIDEGIKKIVIALRLWGFMTSGSCQGHTGRGTPYPWVEIYAPDQRRDVWIKANELQREKLSALLGEFYKVTDHKYIFTYEDIGIFGGFRLINKGAKTHNNPKTTRKTQLTEFDIFADFLVHKLQVNDT
jgi:hypothetical protein